jgi:hypothetical protein
MITPEPRRFGASHRFRVAPGRRPSLGGAGVVPEKFENTWQRALIARSLYWRQRRNLIPRAGKNPDQAGSVRARSKRVVDVACFGQVR